METKMTAKELVNAIVSSVDTWHTRNNAVAMIHAYTAPLTAEVERLREALEGLLYALDSAVIPAQPDPDYHEEVKALGKRIGFGAMMSTASAGWREYLEEKGYPSGGEFVSGPCFSVLTSYVAKAKAALDGKGGE